MNEKANNNIRIYLIISTIVLLLSLLPALGMAMLSPMMFDSPGSNENNITLAIVISLVSYPVITVIVSIAAWVLYSKNKHRTAGVLISIPYLIVLLVVALFIALEVFCDGNFSC